MIIIINNVLDAFFVNHDKLVFIMQRDNPYKKDGYYITVNIRGCISFLYEIRFENLFDFLTINKPEGFYENYIKNLSL